MLRRRRNEELFSPRMYLFAIYRSLSILSTTIHSNITKVDQIKRVQHHNRVLERRVIRVPISAKGSRCMS